MMRTRGQDALKQLAADGQNTIELGCGEGGMKEEPNAIRHASLAQLCTSKRNGPPGQTKKAAAHDRGTR